LMRAQPKANGADATSKASAIPFFISVSPWFSKRRPILAYRRANAFKRRRLRRNTKPRRVGVVDRSPLGELRLFFIK